MKEFTSKDTIRIDQKTEIDSPLVQIISFHVNVETKGISIECRFTSGNTVLVREISGLKYDTSWTLADIEDYIQNYLSTNKKIKTIKS